MPVFKMKSFSTAVSLLALVGGASAFSSVSKFHRSAAYLRMSEPETETPTIAEDKSATIKPTPMTEEPDIAKAMTEEPNISKAVTEESKTQSEGSSTRLPKMSQALPFLERPAVLTGELAGDVGFDPFGFAKSKEDLMNYREAEIKHARLAMLAAAGWPISELFDRKIANLLNLTPALDSNDRVPALLNGGLGKISPLYWIACIAAAAAIDLYGISRSRNDPNYSPGKLGFDPLGVYPKDEEGKRWMDLAEIKNGRLAMIAVFGFAIQEFVTKSGVVNETPAFFQPLSETFESATNSGYIQ